MGKREGIRDVHYRVVVDYRGGNVSRCKALLEQAKERGIVREVDVSENGFLAWEGTSSDEIEALRLAIGGETVFLADTVRIGNATIAGDP